MLACTIDAAYHANTITNMPSRKAPTKLTAQQYHLSYAFVEEKRLITVGWQRRNKPKRLLSKPKLASSHPIGTHATRYLVSRLLSRTSADFAWYAIHPNCSFARFNWRWAHWNLIGTRIRRMDFPWRYWLAFTGISARSGPTRLSYDCFCTASYRYM